MLPFRQIFPLLLVQFSQAVQVMMLFPMLVFMVRFYGVAGDDPKAVGTYTGILASMFPLTMFITSFFWGWVSDRVGRKPVALIGVFSVGTGSILLGFTRDYYTALTIRVVSGLFNNITSMLKCMIAEMSGEHQAKGMAWFSVAWTTGTLLGPSLAGILAMPCQQYGEAFPTCSNEDSLLKKYPFFLSFVGFGSFTLFAGVYAALVVPETLKSKKSLKVSGKLARVLTFTSLYAAKRGALEKEAKYKQLGDLEEDSVSDSKDIELTPVDEKLPSEPEAEDEDEEDGLLSISAKENGGSAAVLTTQNKGWFNLKEVQIGCFLYCFVALFYVAFEELFPLFGSTRVRHGGLSLASKDVGIFMSIGGGCTIPYTLIFFPRIIKAKGTLWMVKFGSIICMLLSILTPFMRLLATQPGEHSTPDAADAEREINKSGLGDMSPLLWVVMTVHAIFIHVTGTNCFASVIMVVNKASPKEHFGSVNSYGQALASLARVVGPGTVGWLWTTCARIRGTSVMVEVTLPFIFCGLSAFAMFVLACMAPQHLNSFK